MKELLAEHGWLGATIIILIQFLYMILSNKANENRKILLQIQKDVNMSFALLRIMSGDKYHEYVERSIKEKVLRE